MAWNYTDTEFLKLYRKFVGWEWYQNVPTKVLFLHCLLRANWKAGSWMGINYEPGQFITSLQSLALETGLSVRQVRTALNHLKATGEVTDLRQANFRIITVKNWNRYQAIDKPSVIPETDHRQTIDNRYKNNRTKEVKKYVPPTKENIEDYIYLRHFENVDVDAFMDFNESLGWKMEWHRALDQWVENQKKREKQNRSRNPFLDMKKRDYDFDAIERMFENEEYTDAENY